jgi:hypothetical protein
MLAAHAQIAAFRKTCSACAYTSFRPELPSARFDAAAEIVYNTAADIFVMDTFTRCNAAALDSSVAARAVSNGNLLASYLQICTVRTACIAAGDPPAPELPRPHPGASPRVYPL